VLLVFQLLGATFPREVENGLRLIGLGIVLVSYVVGAEG